MPPAQANPLMNFIPLVLIFIIFYFLIIRPQKAKEQEHKNMLSKVKKNDEVVTTGGIHGTVVSVKEKIVQIRVDDNVKIDIEKGCIATIRRKEA